MKMGYTRATYVSQLPKKVRDGIRNAINRNMAKMGIPPRARRIDAAMDSRIGDLDEIIDVDYWLKKANGKR